MEVQVKQKHISRGLKRNLKNCPIALAVKDAGGIYVLVTRDMIFFELNGVVTDQALDQKIVDFIYAFDNDMTVTPISFTL